jgi:hypothetical protein
MHIGDPAALSPNPVTTVTNGPAESLILPVGAPDGNRALPHRQGVRDRRTLAAATRRVRRRRNGSSSVSPWRNPRTISTLRRGVTRCRSEPARERSCKSFVASPVMINRKVFALALLILGATAPTGWAGESAEQLGLRPGECARSGLTAVTCAPSIPARVEHSSRQPSNRVRAR